MSKSMGERIQRSNVRGCVHTNTFVLFKIYLFYTAAWFLWPNALPPPASNFNPPSRQATALLMADTTHGGAFHRCVLTSLAPLVLETPPLTLIEPVPFLL